MPNEIFEELRTHIDIDKPNRSSEHIAYAYSYVYLISYLYRYAVYGDFKQAITEEVLRMILQTPKKYKHKNYITKTNGILHKLKYIVKKSRNDVPVSYEALNDRGFVDVEFETLGEWIAEFPELKADHYLSRNFKFNFPYRAFYNMKDHEQAQESERLGYFFHAENTHKIPLDIFIFCMTKKDLGTAGFYVYSFIKHMNDKFKDGWLCNKQKFMKLTGFKETKLKETLKALESYNMISNSHETYYVNLKKSSSDIIPVPCRFEAFPFDHFTNEKQEIDVREVVYLEVEEKREHHTL